MQTAIKKGHRLRGNPAFLIDLGNNIINFSSSKMSYFHNFHSPPQFYVNGIKYVNDYVLEEYRPQVQAFLTKRRTTKREIRKYLSSMFMVFST